MIVLAIETAGPRGSVALLPSEGLPEQVEFQASGRLGAELAPAIQGLLRRQGLGPEQPPDLVAVDLGPGSYTGLRIGLAAAKGLAFAWGKPLLGVRADEALAEEAPPDAERILCALDASRGEVYAVRYARTAGAVERRGEAGLYDPADLARLLDEPTWVVGDAAERVGGGHRRAPAERAWPTAVRIARIARRRHLAGERQDAIGLAPVYYRPNEAEAQRRQRAMKERT